MFKSAIAVNEFFRLAFTVMCHVHQESSEWPEVVVVNERRNSSIESSCN